MAVEPHEHGEWVLRVWVRGDAANFRVPDSFDGYSVKVESMPTFESEHLH